MQIQKVFQAGNSQVVAIPKELAREVGFSVGKKVIMEKTPNGKGVIIMRADTSTQKTSKSRSDAEFKAWLTQFMQENGEILDELALR